MGVEHLPGCDLRHTPRQQCSSWLPAAVGSPEVEGSVVARGATEFRGSPYLGRRIAFGCLLGPFVPLAFLLAAGGLLTALLFYWSPTGFTLSFQRAPRLPSWAYPEGDVLHRYNSCGGSSDVGPPCRWIVFGTNSTLTTIETELEPEFSKRGWITERRHGDWFSTHSAANDVCISYSAFYREQAVSNSQRYTGGALPELWSRYSATIDVYVDDCSFKG